MANLQYIGARYVPKFYLNPDYPAPDQRNNDWKSGVDYEALTIVTYNNDSYTSKKPVPAEIGNPADNVDYWACTTKYTAALMALQTIVQNLEDFINPAVVLDTTAQTVTEAINEMYEQLGFIHVAFVTPEMYGAKGDGTTNDYAAMQGAIDSGIDVFIPNRSYNMGYNTLKIESLSSAIYGPDSTIIYEGNDYAIRFRRINQKNVTLGTVIAENGSCIDMHSEDYTLADKDRVQYLNLTFDSLKALTNCIHAKAVGSNAWVNEIRISKGRLESGVNGIYIEKIAGTAEINGWRVNEVGIEGVDNGIVLDSTSGAIANLSFNNLRLMEVPTTCAFKTIGTCFNIDLTFPDHVKKSWFIISDASFGIKINAPLYENSPGGGVPLAYHTLIGKNNSSHAWIYDLPETVSGITYNGGTVNTGVTRVRRIGFWISMKIYVENVTLAANEALCTLPFAPVANFQIVDNNGVYWMIENTGVVKPLSALTNQSVVLLDTSFIYFEPLY